MSERVLTINAPTMSCCGQHADRCRCGGATPTANRSSGGTVYEDGSQLVTINGVAGYRDAPRAVGRVAPDPDDLPLPVVNWSEPVDGRTDDDESAPRALTTNADDDTLHLPVVDWSKPVR